MTKPTTDADKSLRGLTFVKVMVVVLTIGFLLLVVYLNHRKNVAQHQRKTRDDQITSLQNANAGGHDLATQVSAECSTPTGRAAMLDRGISCAKASSVAAQPTPTAIPGANGAPGVPGATGPSGARGATGPRGLRGPSGLPGVRGVMGVSGVPGADGLNGAVGSAGPQGAQGDPGVAGPQGDTGPRGDDGSAGPSGPPGPTCPDGTHLAPVQYVDPNDPLILLPGQGCVDDPSASPSPSSSPSP